MAASEYEVKLLLAPLAIAIMSNTPDVQMKMVLNDKAYSADQLVDQYDSLLESLYKAYAAKHS